MQPKARALSSSLVVGLLLVVGACGASRAALEVAGPSPTRAADAPAEAEAAPVAAGGLADVNTDRALITNGSVVAIADPFLVKASALRREVYRLGGRVYAESIQYDAPPDGEVRAGAQLRVKVLPARLPELLDWLVRETTITAENVSSIIAAEAEGDAAIVRAEVVARLAEIDAALAAGGLPPEVQAALERERAELAPATVADPSARAGETKRVAVLQITLTPPPVRDALLGGDLIAHARCAMIALDVLEGGGGHRAGCGVAVGGRSPVAAVEVLALARGAKAERAGVIATLGYGRVLRAFDVGPRPLLVPYVGARIGYAYLDASYLAVAAELGVELFRGRGVVLGVSARPTALLGKDSQVGVEGGASLGLAF